MYSGNKQKTQVTQHKSMKEFNRDSQKTQQSLHKKRVSINLQSPSKMQLKTQVPSPEQVQISSKKTSSEFQNRLLGKGSQKLISAGYDDSIVRQKTQIFYKQYQPQIHEFRNEDNTKQIKTIFKVSVGSCNVSLAGQSPSKVKESPSKVKESPSKVKESPSKVKDSPTRIRGEKDSLVEILNQKFLLKGPSQKQVQIQVPQTSIVQKGIMSNAGKLHNLARRRSSMYIDNKTLINQTHH